MILGRDRFFRFGNILKFSVGMIFGFCVYEVCGFLNQNSRSFVV